MKLIKEHLLTIPKTEGIYLFTNLVNGKHYVGQAVDLRKRLQHHLNNLEHDRYDAPLYRALKKYGIDNFDLKIIKQLIKVKEKYKTKVLDRLEIYFIKYYNSYGATGYNQTKGGDGGVLGYKMTEEQKKIISQNAKAQACDGRYTVYCINIETKEIISDVNLTELSKQLPENINISSIRTAKSKGRIYQNKYYFANTLEEVQNYPKDRDYKNQSDDYLIEYYDYLQTTNCSSLEEVAKELGLAKDTINKRNKKLRELGYILPFSKNKIKHIELIDTINKITTNHSLQELADKFSVTVDTMRKQVKRDSLYKKQYLFNVIYQ